MKKFILAMCLSMAMLMLVSPASATELWDPHLRGVDGGLAAGALPPPGFYFINDFYVTPAYRIWNSNGNMTPAKLFAIVDVPILVFVPECQFLGATYAAAIAQPFDYTNLRIGGRNLATGNDEWIGGAQWGTFNTILVPALLSWKLPYDFYVKAAFQVGFNDASSSPGNSSSGGPFADAGNGTYMFTPNVGVSWLHAGWNISADFFFSWQTENDDTHYQSGEQFAADYTITYTTGKWTFGLVAAQENQVSKDELSGIKLNGSKAEAYTMGPIIGYNFGPCSISMAYQFPLYTESDVGGEFFNIRFVVPLGNPFSGK